MKTIFATVISTLVIAGCASQPPVLNKNGNPLTSNEVDNINMIYLSGNSKHVDEAPFDGIGRIAISSWQSSNPYQRLRIQTGVLWAEITEATNPKAPAIFKPLGSVTATSTEGGKSARNLSVQVEGVTIARPHIRLFACPQGATEIKKEACLLAVNGSYSYSTSGGTRHFSGGNEPQISNGYATTIFHHLVSPNGFTHPRVAALLSETDAKRQLENWNTKRAANQKAQDEAAANESKRRKQLSEESKKTFLGKSKKGVQVFCSSIGPVPPNQSSSSIWFRCPETGDTYTSIGEFAQFGWSVQGESRMMAEGYDRPAVHVNITFVKR